MYLNMVPERYGRTDRQTDRRLTVASPRSALASRGKNYFIHNSITSPRCDDVIVTSLETTLLRNSASKNGGSERGFEGGRPLLYI